MSEEARRILRRADAALVEAWGQYRGAVWAPVPSMEARGKWLGVTYPSLALEQPEAFGHLKSDADRIGDLAHASRDWVIRDVARNFPGIGDELLARADPESRALWLWQNHIEAFEWAERRMQVLAQTGRPRLCNRYQCGANEEFDKTDTDLGAFLAVLSALYKDHDFSGLDVIPVIDWDLDETGKRVEFTLHVSVSRPLTFEQSFNDQGELDEAPLRRPTYWRCRYNLVSGKTDLICDRGTQSLRHESANAFAEHVLGQAEPPVAVEAPAFEMPRLADVAALPHIEELSEWRIRELQLVHADNRAEAYVISSPTDAWAAACRLTHEERGELGQFVVVAAKVEALFKTGLGASKRSEKSITCELFEDGRVQMQKDGLRHRQIRNALAEVLSRDA
tara:strand:+ start:552 stop:1730 length:1179 start_codon:yes stop_codon:yes gene_type:complete